MLQRYTNAAPGIPALTENPMKHKVFRSGDVAEWLKAAVC
jgi:hypothetical protein